MSRPAVGLFLLNLDNDYQQRLRDDAGAAAARFGMDLRVIAARNNADKQVAQIAEAIAPGASPPLTAVLVNPVHDDVLGQTAQAAVSAGIAWGLLNREADYLEAVARQRPDVPVFCVTPDQVDIGRIQGRQVQVALPDGGSILCVTGPARTSSARRRLEGLHEQLNDGTVKVIILEADWTSEGARMAFASWWQTGRNGEGLPDLFAAQNDEMALGVRQAVRDAASLANDESLLATPIIGCDGSPAFGQRWVREGRLWATVEMPSAAGPAMEWLARHRDRGEAPPLHITLPVTSFPDFRVLKRPAAPKR